MYFAYAYVSRIRPYLYLETTTQRSVLRDATQTSVPLRKMKKRTCERVYIRRIEYLRILHESNISIATSK